MSGSVLEDAEVGNSLVMREVIRKNEDGQYLVVTSVSKEEEPRTVTCRGEKVPIKVVTVEDGSGKAKVSLWRDNSTTEARPGDNVTITDVVLNIYNNTTTLNTTAKSEVVPCEAPTEKRLCHVEAIGCEGGEAELFLWDGSSVKVPAELLQQALSQDGESVDIEMATVKGPIKLSVTSKGREVTSITKE
ncbi:uncharacterized protein LOC128549990 [Mercenaria mercenaria]|uniref:uncharacterized protein LOC128549990 n=1 Tax=Mercenaria mercenaria TaxID=6596 RepID=UPI00234E8D91|nr:uncharacterized protein LOC128549990 [Mercenaria mercenaria]